MTDKLDEHRKKSGEDEAQIILEALKETGGNARGAARLLGCPIGTFQRAMRRAGMHNKEEIEKRLNDGDVC